MTNGGSRSERVGFLVVVQMVLGRIPCIFAPVKLMRYTATIILGIAGLCFILPVHAQEAASVDFDPDRGVVVKRDTTFELLFRFRMQDRAVLTLQNGDAAEDAASAFLIRRFRLKLEGHAVSPRLKYKVQLGFSEHDRDVGDGVTEPHSLLDAMIFYSVAPATTIGFGQGKLPGGREAIISSGELELPERPLANSAFTLDRDFGFFAEQFVHAGPQLIGIHAAISQGEGRAPGGRDLGLCYTGRMEWLPFGAFSGKDGNIMEGDLAREPKPKLSLAAAISTNRDARRSRGQKGLRFLDAQGRTIDTFFADALFKYKGWSWQNEFSQRHTEGTPFVQDTVSHAVMVVNEGWGITSQAGRMLGKRDQVVLRYSTYMPGRRVDHLFRQQEEAWMGWSHYLNGHRIKLQSALSYTWQGGTADLSNPDDQWGLIFQVEFGI